MPDFGELEQEGEAALQKAGGVSGLEQDLSKVDGGGSGGGGLGGLEQKAEDALGQGGGQN